MNYKVVGNIYGKLQDEQSRYIFSNRLLYSLTNDERYIQNVIYDSGGGRKLQKAIESHRGQPLILFGAGFWGRRILRFFPNENWCCYVDNILSSETMIDGLQVISFEEMKKKYSAPFIVIATRKYYKEIEKQLKDNGFDMKNTISSGRLSDEMIQNQYFETSIISLGDEESFVDCGAYDGLTSEIFAKRTKNSFRHIYMFEPNIEMANKCNMIFDQYNNVDVIRKGVWNTNTNLKFYSDGPESSVNESELTSTEHGNMEESIIPAITLDDIFSEEKISMIKMDIEGAEKNALTGARELIKRYQPKLAISIYHKREDIWELTDLILKINPDYKFYIRHYTLCEYDTILYAI